MNSRSKGNKFFYYRGDYKEKFIEVLNEYEYTLSSFLNISYYKEKLLDEFDKFYLIYKKFIRGSYIQIDFILFKLLTKVGCKCTLLHFPKIFSSYSSSQIQQWDDFFELTYNKTQQTQE
jgi:hypothetical protein